MQDHSTDANFNAAATKGTLAHEMELVRGAIDMIAGQPETRITLGGMSFGEEILPWAVRTARQSLVRLEPIWRADFSGCDFVVYADAV
jgi:hypothetical protein